MLPQNGIERFRSKARLMYVCSTVLTMMHWRHKSTRQAILTMSYFKGRLFAAIYSFSLFSSSVHAATNATTIEIRIPVARDGLDNLEGTLRLPKSPTGNASSTMNSFPGVVLIHGSGPQNRDVEMSGQLNMQFSSSVFVFRDIAEALQEQGIAVLTYDKRSCGVYNGCSNNNSYPLPWDNLTVYTFLDDAYAAVKFLQDRPEVQSDHVVVAGHSQSGNFVPILLRRQPNLYGGVIIAGPYRQIDDTFLFQYESSIQLLESLGLSEQGALETIPGLASLQEVSQQLKALHDDYENNGSGNEMVNMTTAANETSPLVVGGASAEFWKSWFDVIDRSKDAALSLDPDQHLLILSGELDWNVPVEDAWEWYNLLGGNSANNVEIATPPCVTHALNCVNLTEGISGENVSSIVLEALATFILSSQAADDGSSAEGDITAPTSPPTLSPTHLRNPSTDPKLPVPTTGPTNKSRDSSSVSASFDLSACFEWKTVVMTTLGGFCLVFL